MLGEGGETLAALAAGEHAWAETLRDAEEADADPRAGRAAPARTAPQVLARRARSPSSCGLVRDGWNGFNVLHRAAARVGGLDLGFVPGPGGRDVAGILDGCRSGEIEVALSARRRRDRHAAISARPSSSIRAITATAAPRAPM